MAPNYKLTYFNVRALAEPIRFQFAYAGVSYEDIRLERDTWAEKKSSYAWGTLPVLEVDGQVIGQSGAIQRYLAKQFGLCGENDFEAAKCDEMVEAMADLGKAGRDAFLEPDEEKKKVAMAKFMSENMAKTFGKWNEILEKNGGFLVGKQLTYADFWIGSFLQLYQENLGPSSGGNIFIGYPALEAHQSTVLNTPGIKEWVAKRPKTQW